MSLTIAGPSAPRYDDIPSEALKFAETFFCQFFADNPRVKPAKIHGWALAVAALLNELRQSISRNKELYAQLVSLLGKDPASWIAVAPRIAQACFQKSKGQFVFNGNIAFAKLVSCAFAIADKGGVPGDDGTKKKIDPVYGRYATCVSLVFSALVDLQDQPNGFFVNLLGGKCLEKWIETTPTTLVQAARSANLTHAQEDEADVAFAAKMIRENDAAEIDQGIRLGSKRRERSPASAMITVSGKKARVDIDSLSESAATDVVKDMKDLKFMFDQMQAHQSKSDASNKERADEIRQLKTTVGALQTDIAGKDKKTVKLEKTIDRLQKRLEKFSDSDIEDLTDVLQAAKMHADEAGEGLQKSHQIRESMGGRPLQGGTQGRVVCETTGDDHQSHQVGLRCKGWLVEGASGGVGRHCPEAAKRSGWSNLEGGNEASC